MMEKPLATTEEECRRLIDAARKNNVTLLVGHIERFNPAVEQMGKILSDTSKIRSLTAQRMSAASGRITDVDVAMDLMIHDVEVIQSLVKSPVVNVQAAASKNARKMKAEKTTSRHCWNLRAALLLILRRAALRRRASVL